MDRLGLVMTSLGMAAVLCAAVADATIAVSSEMPGRIWHLAADDGASWFLEGLFVTGALIQVAGRYLRRRSLLLGGAALVGWAALRDCDAVLVLGQVLVTCWLWPLAARRTRRQRP